MTTLPAWFVIVNPASGGGRARRRWPALRAALEQRGVPFRSVCGTAPGHTAELAAHAVVAGERRLLVVGGDGSFHELVNGLHAQQLVPPTELIAGVAPYGSGNDWARMLDVPGDPARLADAMARCRMRCVDLGIATCMHAHGGGRLTVFFHNVAGAGLDAAVLRRTPSRGPRALAYLSGLFRALREFQAPQFEVSADGERSASRCLVALAAIGPECGGGMRLAPAARPDDGLLDLVLVEPMSLWRAIALAPGLFNGRAATDRVFRARRCREAVLSAVPECEVEADGQLLGRTPLTVSIRAGALQVLDCRPAATA